VAVLGNDDPEASVPGEIIPSGEFYDYAAKYVSDDSRTVIPAAIDEARTAEVRALAIAGVQGDRRRRHGARRLPARRRQPGVVPE
jgi:D-alanine-D-alanine ligase